MNTKIIVLETKLCVIVLYVKLESAMEKKIFGRGHLIIQNTKPGLNICPTMLPLKFKYVYRTIVKK